MISHTKSKVNITMLFSYFTASEICGDKISRCCNDLKCLSLTVEPRNLPILPSPAEGLEVEMSPV